MPSKLQQDTVRGRACGTRHHSAFKPAALSIFLAFSALGSIRAQANAAPIDISGWPIPDVSGSRPGFSVGDDPVFGRLACPPLTRLNLDKKRSEPLLVKKVNEEFNNPEKGSLWRFDLRSDIYWWNGDELKAEDVAMYLRQQLAEVIKDRADSLWALPEFSVAADSKDSVAVRWRKPPTFGPYVLNGAPLWRQVKTQKSGQLPFECVGLYVAESTPQGLSLKPAKGYRGARPELLLHSPKGGDSSKDKGAKSGIEFQRAKLFGGSPWARFSDEEAVCKQRIELPFVTIVSWNTEAGPTADKTFRRIMTQLTPRGELLRSGAANLGELLSAPIPRLHPGYNTQVLLRPFSMEGVSAELDKLGYRREHADTPRLGKDGKPLKLVVGTNASSSGLLEKVLADAFTAVGISLEFKDAGEQTRAQKAALNGALTGVTLEWPRSDLLLNFHSGLKGTPEQSYPFWPIADKELDRELEAYAQTLTTVAPDFVRLSRVHARLFDLEPVTVILQHEACVEGSAAFAGKLKSVNARDPDWFRRLIL